jgi:hypothetical protein
MRWRRAFKGGGGLMIRGGWRVTKNDVSLSETDTRSAITGRPTWDSSSSDTRAAMGDPLTTPASMVRRLPRPVCAVTKWWGPLAVGFYGWGLFLFVGGLWGLKDSTLSD